MPIRTASVNRQLEKNGQRLHQALMARVHAQGADQEPSEAERALMLERESLKQERARRHEEAGHHPKHKARELVRTHHATAKEQPKPKVKKEKEAKAQGKAKPTRAEKQASKAAALAAAKKAAKKPMAKG